MTVYLRNPDVDADDATWHWRPTCHHHRRLAARPRAVRVDVPDGRPSPGELCNTCLAIEGKAAPGAEP